MAMDDVGTIVDALRGIEERLRELAYERLRAAAEDGDASGEADERRIQQARRAVERARRALGGGDEAY
jgi:hypothetical protein